MMLAPQLELDFAGHVALMFGDFTNVEILPEARFRYLMDRKLSLYGDGGFGVAFASGNGASQTWAVLRFAGGVQYKIDQNLSFLGEPVALNFYLGDGGGFQYGLAAGVLYKF
jgi:hypothetical protein